MSDSEFIAASSMAQDDTIKTASRLVTGNANRHRAVEKRNSDYW